jgi:hypothetical protein
MIRDLVESLHLYSDPVGDLAKWSGKYMTGVTTLCMCKNKCNNGSSVKKLMVLKKNTERRMTHEMKMRYPKAWNTQNAYFFKHGGSREWLTNSVF